MTWERFPHHWPFVRGINQLPVDFIHKGPVIQSVEAFFCFEPMLEQIFELSVIWSTTMLMGSHCNAMEHYDVIKWNYFPHYWPFVWGIHRSAVNSPHKGQWRGALMFSLICALNKRLSKQSSGWWFETPLRSLWRHCNGHSYPLCLFSVHLPINFVIISDVRIWTVGGDVLKPCSFMMTSSNGNIFRVTGHLWG